MQLVLSLKNFESGGADSVADLTGVRVHTIEPAGALEWYSPATDAWQLVTPDQVLTRESLEAGHVRVFIDGFQAATPSFDFAIEHSSRLGELTRMELSAPNDELVVSLTPLGALENELNTIGRDAEVVMSINSPLYVFEDPPNLTVQTQQQFDGATFSMYTQKSQIYVLNEQFFLDETPTLRLQTVSETQYETVSKLTYQGNPIGVVTVEHAFGDESELASGITVAFQGEGATREVVDLVLRNVGYENTLSLQSREIFAKFELGEQTLLEGKLLVNTNNPPITSDHFIEMDAPVPETLKLMDFNYYDSDGDVFDRVQIKQAPISGGELQFDASGNGTWLKVEDGAEIPVQAIRDGHLRFVPNAEMTVNGLSMFEFAVSDGKSWSDQHSIVFSTKELSETPDLVGSLLGETFEDHSDFNMITNPVAIPGISINKLEGTIPLTKLPTTYGEFSVDQAGHWSYTTSKQLPELVQLGQGQVLEDPITVQTTDGREFKIVVIITGGEAGPEVNVEIIPPEVTPLDMPGPEDIPQPTYDPSVLAITPIELPVAQAQSEKSDVKTLAANDNIVMVQASAHFETKDPVVTHVDSTHVIFSGDTLANLELVTSLGDHAALTQTRELPPEQLKTLFVNTELESSGRLESTLIKTSGSMDVVQFESKLSFVTPTDDLGKHCDLVLIQRGEIKLPAGTEVNQDLVNDAKPSSVTLHMVGHQQDLDLTLLNPETLHNLDRIDLGSRDASANHVSLNVSDVLNLGQSHGIGELDGVPHLVVSGDARDSLTLKNADGGVWQKTDSTSVIGEHKFDVYQGSHTQGNVHVLVSADDPVNVIIS